MRLKLTYARSDGQSPVDLLVTTDASATVSDLAEYLARADPDHRAEGAASTLEVKGVRDVVLAPTQTLADSDIGSGAIVTLSTRGRPAGAAPEAPAATVVVISGPDKGKEFPIATGTSYIGRGRDCEVRLSDPMLSRRHAKIHVAETVELSDLGSVNGILVGDAPVDKVVLHPGDTAYLGETLISVRFTPTAAPGGEGSSSIRFIRAPRITPRFEGKRFVLPEPPSTPPRTTLPHHPVVRAPSHGCRALYRHQVHNLVDLHGDEPDHDAGQRHGRTAGGKAELPARDQYLRRVQGGDPSRCHVLQRGGSARPSGREPIPARARAGD